MPSYSWIALAIAILGQFADALVLYGIPVLYPFIQANFALTRTQVGLISSSLAAGGLLTVLVGGWLADVFGVRRVMFVFLSCTALFMIALTIVPTFVGILALVTLIGVAVAPGYPATSRIIMDWLPLRVRGLSMSLKQSGVPLAGAAVAAILPTLAISIGWRNSAAVVGAIIMVVAIIYLACYRDTSRSNVSTEKPSLAALFALVRNRNLAVINIWGAIFVGLQYIVISYILLYFIDELKISVVVAGGLLAIAQVSSIVARISWGAASDFIFNRRRIVVLAIIGFLAAASFWGFGLLQVGAPRALLLIVAIAIGASTLAFHGVFTTIVSEIAGPKQTGLAVGISATTIRFGWILFPPLFGKLADMSGSYYLGWNIAAAAALISTLLLIALAREPISH